MKCAIRRLGTLAALILTWLLASAMPAWAHCHGSITYGPSGGMGDCGGAAFWATLGLMGALAAFYLASLLCAFYFLNQGRIKSPFLRGRDFWRRNTYGRPDLFGRSTRAEDVSKLAEAISRLLPPERPILGFLVNYGAPVGHFLGRGFHWIWRRGLGDTLDLFNRLRGSGDR